MRSRCGKTNPVAALGQVALQDDIAPNELFVPAPARRVRCGRGGMAGRTRSSPELSDAFQENVLVPLGR